MSDTKDEIPEGMTGYRVKRKVRRRGRLRESHDDIEVNPKLFPPIEPLTKAPRRKELKAT